MLWFFYLLTQRNKWQQTILLVKSRDPEKQRSILPINLCGKTLRLASFDLLNWLKTPSFFSFFPCSIVVHYTFRIDMLAFCNIVTVHILCRFPLKLNEAYKFNCWFDKTILLPPSSSKCTLLWQMGIEKHSLLLWFGIDGLFYLLTPALSSER